MKRYNKQNGVITRACSGCGGDLKHRYGKARYCSACHNKWMRENRVKHSDLPEEARLKANARAYANVYQKRGLLIQKPCEDCGSNKSEKHHPDHTKPLAVIWLCRPCHLKRHLG